jgi:hypothetical protein
MTRMTLGKVILTFVIAIFSVINVLADWNRTHLFNPAWHPHARFHAGVMSLIVWCVSAIGIWLLWRRSIEPELGVKVAALVALTLWTPFLYVDRLVPGSSQLVNYPASVPYLQLAGTTLYPQVVLALIAVVLTAGGYGLTRSGDAAEGMRRGFQDVTSGTHSG